MDETEPDVAAAPLQCARCVRTPRDGDDRVGWVTIDDDTVCPGCLTMSDSERLRHE